MDDVQSRLGVDNQPAIGSALRDIAVSLEAAGIADPRPEARHVLRAAGVPAVDLIARPRRRLSDEESARLAAILVRRVAREPLSRICGETEFYGRPFLTSAATLDPRADTEVLIEAALSVIRDEGCLDKPLSILDVGTGSGCILLSLLAELPRATGLGTDVSSGARDIAARNAERHGLSNRCRFAGHTSLDGVDEPFDVLVSNPPYIETAAIATLDPEVRDHDPHLALDGGPDGMAIYREISTRLTTVVPNGWALFEIGAGQEADVMGILASACPGTARDRRVWPDLNGHTRCVAVRTRR